jgi:hypothetical protein
LLVTTTLIVFEVSSFSFVMPGLVPGIHVFAVDQQERPGWPGRARP